MYSFNTSILNSQLLLDSIAKHAELKGNESELLLSKFKSENLKKRSFFLKEGEVCKQIVFVLSGCLRSYALDEEGTEHIFQFAPEGWWITDMNSVLQKTPAKLNIDAIEDSEVLLLNRIDQEDLFRQIPSMERFFRSITEKSLAGSHSRLLDYVCLGARERYLEFCKRYPGLIQRLPQKQIASYIGVTPEFLSKLKSDLLKNKA